MDVERLLANFLQQWKVEKREVAGVNEVGSKIDWRILQCDQERRNEGTKRQSITTSKRKHCPVLCKLTMVIEGKGNDFAKRVWIFFANGSLERTIRIVPAEGLNRITSNGGSNLQNM